MRPALAGYLLLGLVLTGFSAHTLVYVAKTQDDTYITLRFADHLARGEGLVFNPGERVEGYSNFLYTVGLAAGIAAGFDPMLLAKSVGFVAGILTLLLTWRLAGLLPHARDVRVVPPALLAASAPFAAWAVLGLETVVYALVIVAATTVMLEGRRGAAAGTLLAAAALMRPEGAVFFVATAAFLAATGERRALTPLAVPFVLIVGAFAAWRFWYYGDLLPNTYYAKAGLGPLAIVRGAKYLFEFFRAHGGPILPFLAIVPLFWGTRSREIRYLWTLCAAYFGFVVWVGGDNFAHFRFVAPILPLLYVLVVEGVSLTYREVGYGGASWTPRRLAPIGALVVFAAAFLFAPVVYSRVPALRNVAVDAPLTDANELVTLGEWLRGMAAVDSTIAVGEAGAVPYVTGWRTLDGFGLTDREIARAPRVAVSSGARKKSPDFVINRILTYRPDFVEFYGVPGFDTVLGPNDDLLWKALLADGYVPVPPYHRLDGFVVLARADVAERVVPRTRRE